MHRIVSAQNVLHAAISRMEETLSWLRWLKPDDTDELAWARAEGTPWKQICWRFGISRATAAHRHRSRTGSTEKG